MQTFGVRNVSSTGGVTENEFSRLWSGTEKRLRFTGLTTECRESISILPYFSYLKIKMIMITNDKIK